MAKRKAAKAPPKTPRAAAQPQAEEYRHVEATSPLRPDVGTQAQFQKKLPRAVYRYDSSLSPALDWDGQNPAREQGEAALAEILELTERVAAGTASKEDCAKLLDAAHKLKSLGRPFLDWSGKAERLSFDVPTLPLFVHERLSTRAIIETLTGHKRDKQLDLFHLFADPVHPVSDQVLRAYEYQDQWTNRLVLGDSLVVMNSLLRYESLGGQVQMIYLDPPYGVKFGSNFQPFVRKRDVKHGDDADLTREPEMVQAYRDTWELGLHSYLTYMRDRLLLARDLLAPTGSIFVQISDENLHHVRELMDEVFGSENFRGQVSFAKTSGASSDELGGVCDFLLWYAKDRTNLKYRQLYLPKQLEELTYGSYDCVESPDGGTWRRMNVNEKANPSEIPDGWIPFMAGAITSSRPPGSFPVEFLGKTYRPSSGYWKTGESGFKELILAKRIIDVNGKLRYKRFFTDFPYSPINNLWTDTTTGTYTDAKVYVVQTAVRVITRCLLMTTDPGDLVLDPTCGSGTTAYVAEQWGRRWISCDVSRVPLALARQRLLTATFPWYELKEEARGPAGGFVYRRKQNKKGEEVGGIVPHVTLKSIANNEPPAEEVLVDRPETASGITRVSGPFAFEATIPTPVEFEESEVRVQGSEGRIARDTANGTFTDRLLEILRKSPVLRLAGNKTVTFKNLRLPAKTLSLSAEALVDATAQPVAFVFGPENGAVSEKLVYQAAKEAAAKSYTHLYVIGFAIQPNARAFVEQSAAVCGVPATYVQATPDLLMGDLLKNMRSSQIFSVCGLPEVKVRKAKAKGEKNGTARYEVELLGLDVFDPVTMESQHRQGNDVPAWFLDTDYNELCFHVSQAFFPRTAAWNSLRKSLRREYDEGVWDHLAGTISAPFEAGEHRQIAVKVIDDRGNELVVIKPMP